MKKDLLIEEIEKIQSLVSDINKINSDLPKTEGDWIEEKRKKFAEIANKNNPYIGLIFQEKYLNNNAYKVVRVSDGKILYKASRYPAVYNRAIKYNVKVTIEK